MGVMRSGRALLALTAVVVGLSLLAVPGTSAQQKPIRSVTNTVEIHATIMDRQGRLVPDLTMADFEVQDNGKTQPITVFDAGIQPITIVVLLDESPSVFESTER